MSNKKKTLLAALALLVSLVVGGCATHSADHYKKSHAESWIGTWGASPTVPASNSQALNNQTLRLIVHTTLGGDQVRIRISNTFGLRPLFIGGVSIALQEVGAALVTDSNHPLAFGGHASIRIPPGALVVSDPVKWDIAAQRNVAVSLFLPSDTGPATLHPVATQISFISSEGNFVARSDATPFVNTIQTWPFLTAVEVHADKTAHAVVMFGDSITDGYKSTVDANHRWPDYFSSRLLASKRHLAVVNEGISGNRLWHDAVAARPIFGPNALSRFDRDALTVSGASHVVVLLGTNDIGLKSAVGNSEEQVSADDVIAGLRQLALRAHARGLKIIGATLTPFGQGAYYSELSEAKRQTVNQWIRGKNELDGVIDFDAAVRDPAKPSQFLGTYDSGDHLHPSDAGYKAMADSIDLSLFDGG